jgi:(E)-4-hydroxy-3-methylbut-2-enyl-diphosphate synthase
MTNTDTRDIAGTNAQIRALVTAGCELVRVAVLNRDAADALSELVKESPVPLIADIHFDYRLAIAAIDAGVAKVRVNPGNLGGHDRLREVAAAAKSRGTAIRVGVNTGSVDKEILARYGHPTPEAVAQSALMYVGYLEDMDFHDIVVSVKSSRVLDTIAAYRLFARESDVPLHVGLTEAGTPFAGAIKSAVAIGTLLQEGIGDTIRVSLTGDPVPEVYAAREILKAVGLRKTGLDIISCPTCGRTQGELIRIVEEFTARVGDITTPLTVAIMGCPVNGPGEAKEADVGLALGKDKGVLFRNGQLIKTVSQRDCVDVLEALVRNEVRIRSGGEGGAV